VARDYYGMLGVSKSASDADLKRAYRKLARELHPDINPDEAAQAKFKEISVAYEVLSDPEKRRIVDLGGDPLENAGAAGGGFGGFGNLGDVFEAFFGGGFGGAAASPSRSPSTPRCCATAARARAPTAILRRCHATPAVVAARSRACSVRCWARC
jgi:DnaJ-class molecular chaperone